MRRFLYYFPGISELAPSVMRHLGVASRFYGQAGAVVDWAVTPVDTGPAGAGCLLHSTARPRLSADQQWTEGKSFWCCAEDQFPRPCDLEREQGIVGHETTLGDGLTWRVPLIRRWDAKSLQPVRNLPTSLKPVIEKGIVSYVQQVRPDYAAIDALAERISCDFAAEKTLTIDQGFADAAALLAMNYRLGAEECGLLGLFDSETIVRVLALAIDLPAQQAQAAALDQTGVAYCLPKIDFDE